MPTTRAATQNQKMSDPSGSQVERTMADRALSTYMREKAHIVVQEAFFNATPREDVTMKYIYLEATFIIQFGQPNVLSNFQMTEKNYQDAWKAVCERYNDNRRLIAHHMNA